MTPSAVRCFQAFIIFFFYSTWLMVIDLFDIDNFEYKPSQSQMFCSYTLFTLTLGGAVVPATLWHTQYLYIII